MNLTDYSLRRPNVIWFLLAIMLLGGVYAFTRLGKKEDAPFVIKSAVLMTHYDGASPEEVERLITEPIEREIQSMRSVYKITSESSYGLSRIVVELLPSTPAERMPQMWDELRRKVQNIQNQLPDGASEIAVGDDFGDLYGIYYGLKGDAGIDDEELRRWAQLIKTQIVTLDGVQKVTLYGEPQPVVNVYVSMARLSNFSIRPEAIITAMGGQNRVVDSGEKLAGEMQIRILETGTYRSLEDIADQLLTSTEGKQFRLGDVARIEREEVVPPTSIMRIDGEHAIGIGIATDPERDVVRSGRKVATELARLGEQMPLGMEIVELYPEDQIAREANNRFIINLFESVAIVVAVIMLVMGLRQGVVIGSSLVLAIGGTLLVMLVVGEGLNRTSLAGFIIAMGMLVDNAIVVVDNARRMIDRGVKPAVALVEGASRPKWNLLGATLIGVCSFLPLQLAASAVAEMVKPLFVVLAVSLVLSWVLALTQTPLFGIALMRPVATTDKDPFDTPFYQRFTRMLEWLLRHRALTVCVVLLLFAGSLLAMRKMPQNFFPSLDKPYFRVDCFLPDGFNIEATAERVEQMCDWLERQPSVRRVSATVGSTPPRYYLASSSFGPRDNFANILVELTTADSTAAVEHRFSEYAFENQPDVWVRSSLFKLSPATESAIEFGFIGNNIDTLAALTNRVMAIMREDGSATNIRNSWGNRVPTWLPVYSQMTGQRIRISREQMARSITLATSGYELGIFREDDRRVPIVLKDENIDNYNLTNMQVLPVFTPNGRVYPLEQAVSRFDFDYRLGVIKRFNRERVMKAQCDPARGQNSKELFDRLLARVEREVSLPEGYSMRIFGEQESQSESNRALAANVPLSMILIFFVLLLLFGDFRRPIVIMLMLPLIFVGVVAGLLVAGRMFDFFALLGLLGLVGMNIKNAVVLVDQIDLQTRSGEAPYEALVQATQQRVVPVAVASITTVLGMLPLLFDAMFGGMAATIMGGLLMATLLTIFFLPVCYSLFFNIRKPIER
ncbi:MAG: efflux RND transporter permease subunit [Rikenellaceae bacterium]|nr:efflux RND transporter permease subunit [Rikenellaceae bacterium]